MSKKTLAATVCATALAAGLSAVATPAMARDRIQITGSSTVFPFTTAVAERFGQKTGKTPIVESTGTGGGMKLFCSGVGVQTPDVTNASRRITKAEFEDCGKNGVQPIEIKMGFDGIVVANSKSAPPLSLTLEQLYLAMAAEVPNAQGQLVPNPNRNWSDIAPNLPNKKIEVLGPPPTSGTRDSFNELGLLEGCKVAQQRTGAKIDNRKCMQVRADGAFVEAGENDNIIVQKLVANPLSYGVFGFSFLEENQDKIHGAKINDLEPSVEAIQSGKYSMARSMFVYVKKNHIGVVPGLAEFVAEYVSEASFGDDGYLEKKGLVPLPKADREAIRRSATGGAVLTGF
jgi:phosphate transport system substrate-binding protein